MTISLVPQDTLLTLWGYNCVPLTCLIGRSTDDKCREKTNMENCNFRSTVLRLYGCMPVVIRTVVRGMNKRGKRRGMYVPSYSGCTTQILTWGPIADRSFRGLGRSVRSDRPSRSGPMYSVSVYNPTDFLLLRYSFFFYYYYYFL
jgi:hypothetical protein